MFTFWHYFVFIFLFHAMRFASSESNKEKKQRNDPDYDFGSSSDRFSSEANEASKGQFPYAISVQYWGFHYCSGALLSPTWVISSGQCFSHRPEIVDGLTLVAGMVNITDPNVEERNLSKIILHERFYVHDKCRLLTNDIALLKPVSQFPITSVIKPVKLPRPRQTFKGMATLIGWTSHRFGVISLKYVKARLLFAKRCTRNHLPVGMGYNFYYKSMICAKPIDTTITLCVGNTGSPLLYKNILIGLSSTGANPCKTNQEKVFFGVYTKISRYIKFINKYVQSNTGSSLNYDVAWE
ncbi:hypothetical protein ILUMI_08025 [Ignelater luminosus]|uniref:Peptidase S1 domain-containing protein n=1 Tax=Ignelater luminosus TaxID=2038154 RepID=A0A8K0GB23_IGNLU|nr:hypothetical protein ILUMI_08025 [Ignelater luminosus]